MTRPPSILAAIAIVLAAARISRAYDGSGGAKVAALLSRVEFAQGGGPEFDPPLADRQYSREEISWVENHAFKDRPIAAFNPDAAPAAPREAPLDPARSRAAARNALDMAQALGR
ncbi:MAG: hypothetical protein ACHQ2Z_09755 [Elusimicrobiota bacterium]